MSDGRRQTRAHLELALGLGVRLAERPPARAAGAGETGASQAARPGAAASAPAPDAAWDALEREARACRACSLAQGRDQVVVGAGARGADLLFVGEAPGEEEDRQGLPFVGPAGQLLTKMIEAMGLSRDQVYIANVIKCRPPGNRTPLPDEVASCRGFLERQIALVKPRAIVALGRVAAGTLLGTDVSLGSLRGRTHQALGVPLFVTYHPSYLLRQPGEKGKSWADLKRVIQFLERGDATD